MPRKSSRLAKKRNTSNAADTLKKNEAKSKSKSTRSKPAKLSKPEEQTPEQTPTPKSNLALVLDPLDDFKIPKKSQRQLREERLDPELEESESTLKDDLEPSESQKDSETTSEHNITKKSTTFNTFEESHNSVSNDNSANRGEKTVHQTSSLTTPGTSHTRSTTITSQNDQNDDFSSSSESQALPKSKKSLSIPVKFTGSARQKRFRSKSPPIQDISDETLEKVSQGPEKSNSTFVPPESHSGSTRGQSNQNSRPHHSHSSDEEETTSGSGSNISDFRSKSPKSMRNTHLSDTKNHHRYNNHQTSPPPSKRLKSKSETDRNSNDGYGGKSHKYFEKQMTTQHKTEKEEYSPHQSVQGWILFVLGLPPDLDAEDLEDEFVEVAPIKRTEVSFDSNSGDSAPYALVECFTRVDAEKIIKKFNNTKFMGSTIEVAFAFFSPP